ncbi:MAG: response regulator [Victivallaceae bacterium]|nr:response regulator [Victivallaceae bacterium]
MVKNNRILIVDDQEDLREQLGKLLVNSGQPNKTSSLVQSMRARLMGIEPEKQNPPLRTAPRYDIDTAGQGEEAFEMVKAALNNKAPYAVMFTDMRMPPGWDGLTTAKKIREIDKNIEIVIMTAYADHNQSTIAEEVGMPEKLLYIKKPFQAEEIFQLALSLTAKWNAECLERLRRAWLEKTLVCMRTARHNANTADNPYLATLNSFLFFLNAPKGMAAEWNESQGKWILQAVKGVEDDFAADFFARNSKRLQGSNAVRNNIDEVYVIPLKSNDFSVIIGICDARPQTDPEWYKLLNLLVMTSLEGLENASIKAKKDSASTRTRNLVAIINGIRSDVRQLQKKYDSDQTVKSLVQKVDNCLETANRENDLGQ